MAPDPIDPELNFFIQPKAKADLCYAEITGLKDKLVDYYVEAVDKKGNKFKTPIQHVYIGSGNGVDPTGDVEWTPTAPSSSQTVTITCKSATAASKLHWGVNSWIAPIAAYQPAGTTPFSVQAVQTPFQNVNGVWQVVLGPFNNPDQVVTTIDFVIKHSDDNWDNNNGSDYTITISGVQSDNPTGTNISKTIDPNGTYTFTNSDFGFYSPIGNSFKGIKILSLPSAGTLKASGTNVAVDQLITDVTQLNYTATTSSSSFTFKIVDNTDKVSDASYTASFNVNGQPAKGITVTFKKPTDWGTAPVNIWAWTPTKDLFTEWPGELMEEGPNGWYSYTFDSSITSVNVIFSKNGTPQSVDILGVSKSTCYEIDNPNNKFTVKEVACEGTGLTNNPIVQSISIYPQPAKTEFFVNLPNTGYSGDYELNIIDLNGKTVQTTIFKGQTSLINCENVPKGVYLVKIRNENGSELYASKLVKI
jgi:hypothetical protein